MRSKTLFDVVIALALAIFAADLLLRLRDYALAARVRELGESVGEDVDLGDWLQEREP